MLAFESQIERDFYKLLEFDPCVRKISEQPVRISYRNSRGRICHYTPDCIVEYYDDISVPHLVEAKPRAKLLADWKNLHEKFRAGARWARRHGMKFRIVTEGDIPPERLYNATWLMAYRSIPVPQDEIDLLINALRRFGSSSTPYELLESAAQSREMREALSMTLWYAIANGFICVNLDVKLSMSSAIWLSNE